MKKILSLLLVALMIVGMLPLNAIHAHAEEVTATLSFASKDQRTSLSTSTQVWEQNGIKFTNNKASASSNVADYANPVRLYKGSEIIIEYPQMTKIVVTCTSDDYATALKGSKYPAGVTASASSKVVTISLSTAADSCKITSLSAKCFVNSITVYANASSGGETTCQHTNKVPVGEAVEAACTTTGKTAGVKCADCGETITAQETIPALGHNYELNEEEMVYECSRCDESYEVFYVSFSVPSGVTAPEAIAYTDGGITLPKAPEGTLPNNDYEYEFVGWTAATVEEATTEAPAIYEAGAKFEASEAVTLKAVYSFTVAGAGSSDYVLTDIADISATDSVVITMKTSTGTVYALTSANGASKAPTAVVVSVSGDKLTGTINDELKWNVVNVDGGFVIYIEGSTSNWLYCTNANNGVRAGNNTANVFVVDTDTNYLKHNGTSRYLGIYNNQDWRCYTSNPKTDGSSNIKNQTLGFYVKGSGNTTYYLTEIVASECEHEWDEGTVTTSATCDTNGVMTYACTLCKETKTESIEALGHSYESVVTAPTCTEKGYTTHTCSVCEESYTDTEVPANGHSYVDGICSVCQAEKPEGYELITLENVVAGNYIIGAIRTGQYPTIYPATNKVSGDWTVSDTSITITGVITDDQLPADAQVFTFEGNNTDGFTISFVNGDGTKVYLGYTDITQSRKLAFSADYSNIKWTVGVDAEGGFVLTSTDGTNKYTVSQNGTSGAAIIRGYKDTPNYIGIYLFAKAAETETPDPSEPTDPSEPETPVDPPATETPDTPTEAPAVTSATITFDDKTKRTEYSTTQQVWTENDITVTNNKAESTTNVGDYAKPARFYKNSELIIAYEGMVKIVLNSADGDYLSALTNSLDVKYTVDGNNVTIEFAEPVDSFDFVCSAGQVRLNAVTVYAIPSGCAHSWSDWQGTDATCTEDGTKTRQCSLCQKTETQNIKATGHSYSYSEGVLSCVNGDVTIEKSTIAVAKAYTDDTQLYLIEGVVTFVDGQKVFIQDETAGICVYFTNAAAAEGIAVGDKIAVWDTMTTYKGLIETTYTTKDEYTKISEGNTVAAKEATIADLGAYLCEKVTLNNLTVSAVDVEDGEATYTVSDGTNKIDIYGVKIGESDPVAVGSIINVEAVVSIFNNYQLVTSKEQIKVLMGVQKWNITLGDDISVNFNIHVADDIAATTQVKVTFNGETDTYMASELEGAIKVNVAAAQMGDKITVEIGQEFKKEYSVKAYADYILEEANGFDAKTKALVTEMLAYGAAAQTYFGYNQNNLVFTGTAGTAEPTTAKEMDVSGTAEGVRFYGASLVFENKIAIRYYFVVDDGVTLDVAAKEKGGLYYVEIADILPQTLDQDCSVTVNGLTVTYNPMNYIVRMYAKGGKVAALVQALYNYHLAAVAYAKPAAQ